MSEYILKEWIDGKLEVNIISENCLFNIIHEEGRQGKGELERRYISIYKIGKHLIDWS